MNTDVSMENQSTSSEPAGETRNRPSYDDVNTPVIVLVGFISAIATLLTIWAVEGLYYHWERDVQTRNMNIENYRLIDEINAQKDQLKGVPEMEYVSLESVVPTILEKYRPQPPAGNGEESAKEQSGSADH